MTLEKMASFAGRRILTEMVCEERLLSARCEKTRNRIKKEGSFPEAVIP